tara:strand:+ start:581 stop:2284 length:1704 start_codon:yes stop_codon:yes gene_type:complete
MKTKILSLFLLTAILSVAMISATVADDVTLSLSNDLTKSVDTTTLTISNSGAGSINVDLSAIASISDGNGHVIPISDDASNPITIAASDSETVIISHSLTDTEKKALNYGAFSTTVEVENSANSTDTQPITLNFISGFCEIGSIDTDDLTFSVDVDNRGEGDDTDWFPRDTVEVTIKFDNDKDDDLDDVIVEFGLIEQSSGNNVADELDWISSDDEEADIGDVRDGKDAEHTFEFKVPNDIDDGNYNLLIKVYPKGDEDITCIGFDEDDDFLKTIDISRESDDERQVIFEDIVLTDSVPCGQEATLSLKAYNIGSGEQEAVKVTVFNQELGLDINEVFEKFDEDESKVLEFSFLIPTDITEGTYTLSLKSLYDYDEDEDEDNDDEINFEDAAFDEESDAKKITLKVEGQCVGSVVSSALITAELDSSTPEAIAGKQVIIKSTIKNTGTDTTTYAISVFGNSAWSSLSAIDPAVITLDAGESADVDIFLDVDEDAEAEQEFTIKATYDDQTTEQRVALLIEEGVTQDVVIDHLRENWFIYVIALINIILIIAIIAVVKSMVSRNPSAR